MDSFGNPNETSNQGFLWHHNVQIGLYHQIKMVKAWQEAFSELKGQKVAIMLLMTIKQIMGCNVHITKEMKMQTQSV